jgi:hypothetical protein
MKYYLYISDAKVDMLLPQISDAHKKKVATEFGFDVKIFSAKRKVEEDENDNRIARLETVASFIREFGNLGTVEKPNEYIEDSMSMYFTVLDPEINQPAAYFTGKQLGTLVALGGSGHHLLGVGKPAATFGASLAFRILYLLNVGSDEQGINKYFGMEAVLRVYDNLQSQRLPLESLRFMAKRLAIEQHGGKTIILGTPLYVAKDD